MQDHRRQMRDLLLDKVSTGLCIERGIKGDLAHTSC